MVEMNGKLIEFDAGFLSDLNLKKKTIWIFIEFVGLKIRTIF